RPAADAQVPRQAGEREEGPRRHFRKLDKTKPSALRLEGRRGPEARASRNQRVAEPVRLPRDDGEDAREATIGDGGAQSRLQSSSRARTARGWLAPLTMNAKATGPSRVSGT